MTDRTFKQKSPVCAVTYTQIKESTYKTVQVTAGEQPSYVFSSLLHVRMPSDGQNIQTEISSMCCHVHTNKRMHIQEPVNNHVFSSLLPVRMPSNGQNIQTEISSMCCHAHTNKRMYIQDYSSNCLCTIIIKKSSVTIFPTMWYV